MMLPLQRSLAGLSVLRYIRGALGRQKRRDEAIENGNPAVVTRVNCGGSLTVTGDWTPISFPARIPLSAWSDDIKCMEASRPLDLFLAASLLGWQTQSNKASPSRAALADLCLERSALEDRSYWREGERETESLSRPRFRHQTEGLLVSSRRAGSRVGRTWPMGVCGLCLAVPGSHPKPGLVVTGDVRCFRLSARGQFVTGLGCRPCFLLKWRRAECLLGGRLDVRGM